MTPVRKALAAVVLAVLLLTAVVVQLTVVNRLPLPEGAVPDLVLLLVTAIAVTTTPALAAVTGFASGLAVDIAPPAAHYAGEYALVFCLAAYAAARVTRVISNTTGERDPVSAFTVMAVAAAAGEAGKAALGLLLSDPDVTRAAVSRVLPAAVLYDLLLAPFAFLLVALVMRRAAPRSAAQERVPALTFSGDQRLASVFRQASAGAAPKLRLAGTGTAYGTPPPARRPPPLRFAGTGENYKTQPAAGRVPKLRLSGPRSWPVPAAASGSSGSPSSPLPAGRTRKLNFAGDLPVRAGARPAGSPRKNWLKEAASPARPVWKHRAAGPARGWLRAGAPRRAGSPVAASRPRTADQALAARSAPSGLSALAGPGTPLAGRRSPPAGWLRSARAAPAQSLKRSPRSGWLGNSRRPRTVIGSGMVSDRRLLRRQGAAGGNWHTGTPSGAWLRRGRGHLRRGRPRVSTGARPMAETAMVTGARKPRLFGLLGGRR
ncbi:MAG TPA: rod shape-determining protein MreD [Trebonia sp.]|nr:rod shape-determining protein MreD [Trebonia sp.]